MGIHLRRIRELRDAQGLTQDELAKRADVRRATVADVEAGRTKRIDLETLARIAEALGVNAAALIVHEPAKRRSGSARD